MRDVIPVTICQEMLRMDTIPVIVEVLTVILAFLNLFFVPGFVVSLVFFPRFTDLGLLQRLAYSMILSVGLVIAFLFVDVVLGVYTTPGNISLILGVLSAFLLVIWLCEIWYLNSSWPAKLNQRLSKRHQALQKYVSRMINSTRDRFTKTAMAGIVWHETTKSERNHINHSYLIDISEEIEIHQVDQYRWKSSERALLPPPYPRTRYFELLIREYRDEGVSLIDDLQVYPVQVTGKSEGANKGHAVKRSTLKINQRIYKKTDTTEVQWIYGHDFHLFAILYSQDTLGQIVDRVLLKLDEIVISIKNGSRVSSLVEDTEKLKGDFDVVLEKPIRTRTSDGAPKHPRSHIFDYLIETDRRKMQAEIVRDLKTDHITPDTFRDSDRVITSIKIPKKIEKDTLKASIKEIKDDNWLYE